MAESHAQTTRGQMIGEKPPEVRTIYAPDGTEHVCSPLDAREILTAGLGYTAEPPAEPSEAAIEQQPEQQPEHGNGAASAETAGVVDAKPDNSGSADGGSQTDVSPRGKARSRKQ